MSDRRSLKRALVLVDDEEAAAKFYKLKVLLPNGTNVTLTLTNPQHEMSMRNFVNLVKEEYDKTRKSYVLSGKMRKGIDWNLAAESYLDFNGQKIRRVVRLESFDPDSCNILRLDVSFFLLIFFCCFHLICSDVLIRLTMIFLNVFCNNFNLWTRMGLVKLPLCMRSVLLFRFLIYVMYITDSF